MVAVGLFGYGATATAGTMRVDNVAFCGSVITATTNQNTTSREGTYDVATVETVSISTAPGTTQHATNHAAVTTHATVPTATTVTTATTATSTTTTGTPDPNQVDTTTTTSQAAIAMFQWG